MQSGRSGASLWVKVFAWLCALMLLAGVLPLYAISLYSHPHYDDYGFSANVRHTWEDTGSVSALLETVAESARSVRQTWQGTYLGTVLSNVQPGVFSESLYFFTTFILLTAFLLCFGFFFNTVLKLLFRAGSYEIIIVTSLALFLMLQLLPQISEGFYWFNGGIGNTFVYSLIALSLALMLRLWRVRGAKAWWLSAALLVLMAALGGGSYGGGLFLICIEALIVLFALWKKHRFRFVYIGLWIVLAVCFAYSVSAPGNSNRAAIMGTRISAPVAVTKSLYYGVTLIGSYLTLPVLAVMLCLSPLLWTLAQNSRISYKHPLLVLVTGIGLFSAQLVPPMYSGVFIGGGRIQNTYYFSFIVMILLYEIYLFGYIRQKLERPFSFSEKMKRGIAVLSAFLFIFGVLGFARPTDGSFGPKNLTGVEAAVSIARGEAQAYDEAMDERERLLNDPAVPDVVLTPLLSVPKTFMADTLSSDMADNISRLLEVYYRKQSVTVEQR
ncbi:MAG: hypothetical protein ABIG45_02690 [Bacillota bacterium]